MNSLDIVDVFDINNKHHAIKINVLAAEDTWETPSLILATAPSGGKVIFSQVTNYLYIILKFLVDFKYEKYAHKYFHVLKLKLA